MCSQSVVGLILCVVKTQKVESAKKELAVLDAKRSNVINIGLTVLPPPNTIKAAILKMDSAIMNREGIEVRCSSLWLVAVKHMPCVTYI